MESGVSFTRLDPDGAERVQRLRLELGVTAFGLNLLRLRPGQRSRVHRHERQEEVYVVLEGSLTLLLEGGEAHELGPGDAVRVAPDLQRQLANRADGPLLVLAVGGAHQHDGGDGRAYAGWEEEGPGRPPAEVPFPPDLPPS